MVMMVMMLTMMTTMMVMSLEILLDDGFGENELCHQQTQYKQQTIQLIASNNIYMQHKNTPLGLISYSILGFKPKQKKNNKLEKLKEAK
jgi:biopolymer transport protein ExbD